MYQGVREINADETEDVSDARAVQDECHINGDLPREYNLENDDQPRKSRPSPSRRSSKEKSYPYVVAMENNQRSSRDRRKSMSPKSAREGYKKLDRSPVQDRSREENYTRSRSRSYDFSRERSCSRIVTEEEAFLKRNHHVQDLNDTDDERVIQCTRNECRGSRDSVHDVNDIDDEKVTQRTRSERHGHLQDVDRDNSTFHNKYIEREDRHHSREKRDKERSWEREVERERRRERESASNRNMEMERNRRRDKEVKRDRDREIHNDREGRDRSRYEEMDVERDRSRDRVRANDRDIDRQRGRERDRDRGKDRDRERDLEKDRERRSDRGRDIENDREKYGSLDNGYGNRDRHKRSRLSGYDEDVRSRKNNSSKDYYGSLEDVAEKTERDEDEQDDFEERVSLKLVEQEEDLNRIKEESRKLRQAILEKHKNLQAQQKSESLDLGNNKRPEQHHDQPVGDDNNLIDKSTGGSDGVDIFAADQLFSVKKSPPQNGVAASPQTSAPGGLGDGTPKVCLLSWVVYYVFFKLVS